MRYYDLSILNAAGQLLGVTSAGFTPSGTGLPTFSSRVRRNGQYYNNPGALNLELDIPVVGWALPQGNGWIKVWGIGLRTIGQASNLNANPQAGIGPAKVILSAGMAPGLPLATAQSKYAGIIAQGQIATAYGNWQGTEQSIDLNLIATQVNPPGGISFTWQPRQNLADAINLAFKTYFPTLTPKVQISPGFVQVQSSQDVKCWYESLEQFASYILDLTRSSLGRSVTGNPYYPGVLIGIHGNVIYATDASQNPTVKQLQFTDLIGQPTWISQNEINFKCVMRADIQVGDMVSMPPDPGGGSSIIGALALTQQGAAAPGAPARSSSVFKGNFMVQEVHHFGNFRQPDWDSWGTTFCAVLVGGPTA